jgi:hypothetical protein
VFAKRHEVRIASGIDFLHQAKTNFGCMTNPQNFLVN